MGVFCGYAKDPCFEQGGYWLFWDRSWSCSFGPFTNEEAARAELDRYLESVVGNRSSKTSKWNQDNEWH